MSILYGEEDDFIILGLTGRTGSGCSTVAEILQTEKNKINHSLISDENPASNEDRKSKIILNNFKETWNPFHLIQASSILTLIFAQKESDEVKKYIEQLNILEDEKILKLINFLELIKTREITSTSITTEKNSKKPITVVSDFYTKELPKICKEIKKEIGDNAFVKIYQSIGKKRSHVGRPDNFRFG